MNCWDAATTSHLIDLTFTWVVAPMVGFAIGWLSTKRRRPSPDYDAPIMKGDDDDGRPTRGH